MRFVIGFFWLLVMVIAVIFVVLNSTHVQFNYYFGSLSMYLPFLLFMTLLVGAGLGFLAMLPWWWRGVMKLRACKTNLRRSEKEISNLRNLPMKDID